MRAALAGSYASVLRERVTERPAPPLYSVSRGTGVRVFVALPVVVDGRVAGAVYLSRTPNNIVKHLYGERGKVDARGDLHPRRDLADRLRLAAHDQPADARADRAHPGASPPATATPCARSAATAPAKWPSCPTAFLDMAKKLQARSDTLEHLRHPCLARAEIAADGDPGRGRIAARRRRRHGAGQAHALLRQHHRRHRPAQPAGAPADRAGARRKLAISATRPRRSPRRWRCCPPTTGLPSTIADGAETRVPDVAGECGDRARQSDRQFGPAWRQARCRCRPPTADGIVTIAAADDGDGISPSNRARIFEPFFTTRRDSGGTGMGLGIVAALVKAHQGTVRLADAAQRRPLRDRAAGGVSPPTAISNQ